MQGKDIREKGGLRSVHMKTPVDADVEVKPSPKRTDTVKEGLPIEEAIDNAQAREGALEEAVRRMHGEQGQAKDSSLPVDR